MAVQVNSAAGAPVRWATFTFDIQGIVPVAYAVFAVALGITAGALLRRVLPAMAATFTVFTGQRFLIAEYARPHYLAPLSRSYPPFSDNGAPRGSLVLSNATLGPNGRDYTAGLGFQQVPGGQAQPVVPRVVGVRPVTAISSSDASRQARAPNNAGNVRRQPHSRPSAAIPAARTANPNVSGHCVSAWMPSTE